jgi:hypothetical protein
MADPKAKPEQPEEELDAVSAAYESISKKLEELRKKRETGDEEESEVSKESTKDENEESVEVKNINKNKAKEDDAVEEIKEDEEDKESQDEPKATESKSDLEPLPGTEDEIDTEVSKEDAEADELDEEDPLDREDVVEEEPQGDKQIDEFEEEAAVVEDEPRDKEKLEEKPTFVRNQMTEDEMEKWEKEQLDPSPKTEEEIKETDQVNDSPDQPDTLDDLASQPEIDTQESRSSSLEAPTQPPEFEEAPIRQIRPQPRQDYYGEQPGFGQRKPDDRFRQSDQDSFGRGGRRRASIWQLLVLALIGLGVIGGTVYFLKYQFRDEAAPSPSPVMETQTPIPTATPTPAPQVDRSKYKVRVLNGTTKTGMAASVSGKLKDLGYQLERTGNATNSAFERTVVRVKEGSQSASLIETLIKDLLPDFDATGTPTLRSNEVADIEVILGVR